MQLVKTSDFETPLEVTNVLTYIGGYLINKLKKSDFSCEHCLSELSVVKRNVVEDSNLYIHLRAYSHSKGTFGGLTTPSTGLTDNLKRRLRTSSAETLDSCWSAVVCCKTSPLPMFLTESTVDATTREDITLTDVPHRRTVEATTREDITLTDVPHRRTVEATTREDITLTDVPHRSTVDATTREDITLTDVPHRRTVEATTREDITLTDVPHRSTVDATTREDITLTDVPHRSTVDATTRQDITLTDVPHTRTVDATTRELLE